MVKCLREFEHFYCVLENKNIIFKIRRSKVTDYAALSKTGVKRQLSKDQKLVFKTNYCLMEVKKGAHDKLLLSTNLSSTVEMRSELTVLLVPNRFWRFFFFNILKVKTQV